MKKMLMLVLVLGLASVASAVPTFTGAYNSGTGVVSVSITNNEGIMNIGLAITDGSGTLSGFAKGASAPADSAFAYSMGAGQDFEGYGEGEIWVMIHITTDTPVYIDGEWLKANFTFATGKTSGFATMYNFDEPETFTNMGTIQLGIVPEPITISLLGLGGLFLRRRK